MINLPVCESSVRINNCEDIDPKTYLCKKCKTQFYLSDDQKSCISNPLNAEEYVIASIPFCYQKGVDTFGGTICLMCFEGFYLTSNGKKCQAHTLKINNCLIMSQTTLNECIKCNNSYYRDNVEGSNEKCHVRASNNENCLEPNELSNECKICIHSNYIKHLNGRYCSPPIDKCKTYDTSNEILTCKYCEKSYYY